MLQQPYHKDFFLDLDEDVDTFDFLSLRRDQQLEYAKEHNSIIPEPFGSRLRPRKVASKCSQTVDQRPMWKQPCKVAAPESYSLQWQHVNLSQLDAFPSTLRSTASPSPSRKRDQPDYALGDQTALPERIAALAHKPASAHAKQQMGHNLTQAGSQMGTRKPSSSRGSALQSSQANWPQGHNVNSAALLQHCIGHYAKASNTHPVGTKHTGKTYALCQHAVPVAPSKPSSSHLQHSLSKQKTAQHCSRYSAPCNAADRSSDGNTSTCTSQATPGARKNSKRSEIQSQQQPHCGPTCDIVSSNTGKGMKASPASASSESQGLQRQETLLGNWVRWDKPPDDKVVGKNVSSSAAAVAPKTPPQPKERYRSPAVHSKQPEAQPLPAFQRHVMPCMMTAATPATDTASQRPNRMYNPSRQWQSHVPPCRTQQQMQPCSKKHDPVLANVVHQPGCSMMQACSGVGHVAGGRWQPSVQYCLSSAEPAVGAGIWEEQATRQWLQELELGLTAAEESAPLLDNQLRNGVLLCDLAGVLEGRIVWGVDRQPRSLQRARANIMAALGQLGMLTAQTCPKGLVHEVEHVLQGRQASIWGLLNHLRVTHPAAAVVPMQIKAQVADRMNTQACNPLKPDRCTATLVYDNPAASAPTTTEHVVSIGPQGNIRCSVPGLESAGEHAQNCGTSVQVQSPNQARSRISSKPIKQSCPYHLRDTLTVSLVSKPDLLAAPSRAVSPQRSQRAPLSHQGQAAAHADTSTPYVRMVAVGPGYSRPEATASVCNTQQGHTQPRTQQQQQESHAAPERCPEPAAASAAGRKAALAQLRLSRRLQQGRLANKQKVQECMATRDRKGSGQQWSSRKQAPQQAAVLNDLELISWAQSKGLAQLSPGMLLEPSFADGRLLCRLVELLTRCTLPGIEWQSPSVAASRHNLAKAMAELKKKPSMPLQHLWQAGNIVSAEPGCIQALLNDVARAYK